MADGIKKMSRSHRSIKAVETSQNQSSSPSTLSFGDLNKLTKLPPESVIKVWFTQFLHLVLHVSIITLVIFSAELIGTAYGQGNGTRKPLNIWQSIYFTLTTISSVGYGDIVCGTNIGRFATALVIAFSLLNYYIKSYEIERSLRAHEFDEGRYNLRFKSRVEPYLGSQANPVMISQFRKASTNLDHLNRRIDIAIELLEGLEVRLRKLETPKEAPKEPPKEPPKKDDHPNPPAGQRVPR